MSRRFRLVGRRYEHCTSHYTRQDTLEANVLAAIQLQVEAALDYDKLLDKLRGSEGEKNIRDQQNALIMADEDAGNGSKAESDSIGNQRMLINRYLDNHPTLSKYPRLEFADDGYTGTNFHRPQFSAMMEKVRHGEINLICVKDFSRFSRDYIETGNYLECTFPFMGVRFISINDG